MLSRNGLAMPIGEAQKNIYGAARGHGLGHSVIRPQVPGLLVNHDNGAPSPLVRVNAVNPALVVRPHSRVAQVSLSINHANIDQPIVRLYAVNVIDRAFRPFSGMYCPCDLMGIHWSPEKASLKVAVLSEAREGWRSRKLAVEGLRHGDARPTGAKRKTILTPMQPHHLAGIGVVGNRRPQLFNNVCPNRGIA